MRSSSPLLPAAFLIAALAIPGTATVAATFDDEPSQPDYSASRNQSNAVLQARIEAQRQQLAEENEGWRNFHRGQMDEVWFVRLDENSDGSLSAREWRESATLFGSIDRNRDGYLSRREIQSWRFNGMTRESLFAELDNDADQRLGRSEWWWSFDTFDRFDNDGDGFVTGDEFGDRSQ